MTVAAGATIAGLALATAAIKASGPVAFGGRPVPGRLLRVIGLLAPALLAALVVTEAFARGRAVVVDARAAGLAAAAVALAARAPLIVAVLAAAVTTAVVRAVA